MKRNKIRISIGDYKDNRFFSCKSHPVEKYFQEYSSAHQKKEQPKLKIFVVTEQPKLRC